ncbi:MAG: hypothetical protein R8F63_04955 [Acidimicrobiales bacterium]|nr:hypothetical protein [Acidimicrobiales bacterium]
MGPVHASRRLLSAVALAVVVFAFWPALIGGGSLVSHDVVATAAPFDSYQPDDFSLENGPGDPINIHAHWAAVGEDLRRGDLGWWNPDLAAGQPTFKGGVPIFNLPYLVAPDWYSPGLVAAIRTLAAVGLAVGFLTAVGSHRVSALAGGVAFGLSGFMVGWMNWPHSSVAALAPGLLWAIERALRDPRPWRVAPLAGVVTLMVWANFPSVLIYVLLGSGVYTLVRAVSEWRSAAERGRWVRSRALVFVGAAVVAACLAGPHVIGFSEYVDWADTSHRIGNPDDSSAGMAYLLTAVAPAVWGSDAVGASWFGEGNWVEFNTHVGSSVVVLALLGLVAGLVGGDRRRRSVAAGLVAMVAIGVLVAYLGGPLAVALGDLTGSRGGLMTRAKVLIGVGMALGAAFGVDWLLGPQQDRRRVTRVAAVVAGLALLALAPSAKNWLDAARANGALRQTVAVSSTSILAAAATIGVVAARLRGRLGATAAGWGLVAIVGAELLTFAMPVPTTVSRSERLEATPAHTVVQATLEPGERLAGEGRTFFPATTQHYDIADARGQLLKSPGYQELLRAIDPDMLRRDGGGTPTNPNIADGTDVTSPVWDVMAVGVWAQFPDSRPPGTATAPAGVTDGADPAVQALAGATVVPEGGLRAVLVEVGPAVGGFVDVRVTTDDGSTTERRWVEPVEAGAMSFAVLGEHLRVGSAVDVEVTAPAPTLLVGVDAAGALAVGTIAGDDDLELLRVGDVILLERPVEPVRVDTAVVVEPDPQAAAALIADGLPPGTAVVDRDVGLPSEPTGATPAVLRDVEYGRGTVTATVDAPTDVLLVVSESHYPGWDVTIDGAAAEVVLADAAFLGVVVPSGTHDVAFSFTPEHLGRSIVLLAVGGLGLALVLGHGWRAGDLRSPLRPRG